MKNIIITGASRGIGRECSILFKKNGYDVIANYNKSEDEAKELLDYGIDIFKADISKREEVDRMVTYVIDKYSKIDVLINNAGISLVGLFDQCTQNDWNEVISTNITGTFNCTQAVVKNMILNKYGKIINISSIWGICGASCEVAYSTSKAAIIGFTKSLAKELGPSNINVNCIAPGIINTQMNSFLNEDEERYLIENTPLMRFGEAHEIAKCAKYLASDESSFITGQVISPNGGFHI